MKSCFRFYTLVLRLTTWDIQNADAVAPSTEQLLSPRTPQQREDWSSYLSTYSKKSGEHTVRNNTCTYTHIHALESCLLYRVQVCRGFSAQISLSLTKNKGIWQNEWAKSLCSTKNVSRKLFKLWVLLNQILLHWWQNFFFQGYIVDVCSCSSIETLLL